MAKKLEDAPFVWPIASEFGEKAAEAYLGAVYRLGFQGQYGKYEWNVSHDNRHEVGMAAVKAWVERHPIPAA